MSDDNILTDMEKAHKAVIGRGDGDSAEFRERLEAPDRKLAESEERYYLLFHNSPLGIFYYDTGLRITDYNEKFVSIMQSTRAKLSGLDASKLEDQSVISACKKALEGGEGGYEGLYRATTSGARIWVSMRTAPIYDKEGRIVGGMGIVEDITERMKAEEGIKSAKRTLEDTVNALPNIFFVLDLNGNLTMWNKTLEEISGYTHEEISKMNAVDFFQGEEKKIAADAVIRGLKEGYASVELRLLTKDKRAILCFLEGRPWKDAEGRIVGIAGNCQNITERKKTEEALRGSEKRYRALFEQAADSIVLIDVQSGELVEFNDKTHENLGYTREEFRKLKIPDFEVVESAEEVSKHFAKIIKEGSDIFETKHKTKDGKIRNIQVTARAISIHERDFIMAIFHDITERKKAVEGLKEKDKFIGSMVQSSAVATFVVDSGHKVLYWNRACEELTGMKAEDLVGTGDHWRAFYDHPRPCVADVIIDNAAEDMSKFYKVYARSTLIPNGLRAEGWYPNLGGKERYIVFDAAPIYDADGKVIAAVETLQDLTERRKAEEGLKESKDYLNSLIGYANAPIIVFDSERKITIFNHAFEALSGYRADEVIGKTVDMLFPEKEKAGILKDVINAIIEGKKLEVVEVPIRNKNGEVRSVLWNSANIYDANGKLQSVIAQGQDITERKKAEERLTEKENFIGSLVQSSAVATFVVDSQHKVLYWNRACEELTGMKAEDLVGTGDHWKAFYDHRRPCVADVIVDNKAEDMSKLYKVYARSTLIPNGLRAEGWYPNLGGKERYIVFDAAPIYDADGKLISAIETLQDLTERKRDEEALRESERRFSDIINFLPDATFVIDNGGKVIAWNRAIEELTGVKAVDMVSKGDYEYAVPFYKKRRPIFVDLVGSSPEDIKSKGYASVEMVGETLYGEVYIPDLNGREALLWLKASPLYDGEGNRVGSIESMRDITERKKAEDALRESERRFSDIINFLPDATFVIDTQGKVMAWNHAIEKMTGMNAADMLGKSNYEYSLCFYDERRPILADLVLKPQKEIEAKYSSIIRADHSLVAETYVPKFNAYLWVTATALYDSKGSVIGAIESLRDITEITQARKEIEKRLDELERFHKVAVDRELRMIELKNRIKELENLTRKPETESEDRK